MNRYASDNDKQENAGVLLALAIARKAEDYPSEILRKATAVLEGTGYRIAHMRMMREMSRR